MSISISYANAAGNEPEVKELNESEAIQASVNLLKQHGMALSKYQARAVRFDTPVELTLLFTPEERDDLNTRLRGKTYWLVHIAVYNAQAGGYRKKLWTMQMLIDAKTGDQIHFPVK